MSDRFAVVARGLSKAFSIVHNETKHDALISAMAQRLRNPFRRLKRETFYAVKDVSFEINRGDVVGLVGRNGSGKSTLLKCLSRITTPTAGEIDLYGRVGSLLEVGTGFHPELTGRENIYLNGAILGMRRKEIESQFDAIVSFAEVERFLDTPVKRYSSGMYVRLAFSVAAHLKPDILIIDEVLAVGDTTFQKKCLGKMEEVSHKEGRTVIFVSHNMGTIRSLCNRALFLRQGVLLHNGDVETAVRMYGENNDAGHTILSFARETTPEVVVEEILLNGSPAHEHVLGPGQRVLDVDIRGHVTCDISLDLEFSLTDAYDQVLAFFGKGHREGDSTRRKAGAFSIRHRILLPEGVNRGDYFVGFDLAHHNVQYWFRCPRAVKLLVEGAPTRTGRSLEYSQSKGFLTLEEAPRPADESRAIA